MTERKYDDYPYMRSNLSMSRSNLSMSRSDLAMPRASVPRSFAPLTKQPSLPNLGAKESIDDIMNRYLKSDSRQSRERTPPISTRRFGRPRAGSFSTDGFGTRTRSDSLSYPFSRSPSFSTRRSPSMAKTLLDSMSMRSGSVAESGYLSAKSRTPSVPQNTYMGDIKTRSQSVAHGEFDKIRSGSVPGSGKIFPKPRSSSAIITGVPPISKPPGSPSARRKDTSSVSYTSYVPKTKQSMAHKLKSDLSGSRDSLLSGESQRQRTASPATSKAGTPVPSRREATPSRGRTSSVGSSKGKGLTRVSELASGGAPSSVEGNTKGPEPVMEADKPSWLRTPASQSLKHLA